jgi:hypothetical protein
MHQTRLSLIWVVMTAGLLPGPLAAQDPQCNTAFPDATRACNTAVDAIRAFYPLAGMIVSGGNPVIGTAGSLGGVGHLSVTARVNAIKASLPDPTAASQSSVPSSFEGALPAPIVEAALGVLRGAGSGLLSVDLLASAVVLPTNRVAGLTVDSGAAHIGDAALGLGYGARVGLFKGGFPIPTLSVSWMHRTVPRIRYGNLGQTFGNGDQFEFNMDLKADNYRAVAGWSFALMDFAAGIGIDRYRSSATNIRFHDDPLNPTQVRTVVINPTNTRGLLFVNGGLDLASVQFVGELGLQTGKDQGFSTVFSDFDPKAAHVFGGIGVRFGF